MEGEISLPDYQVLGVEVGERCRELLQEIAMSKERILYVGSINWDHVHRLIGISPGPNDDLTVE